MRADDGGSELQFVGGEAASGFCCIVELSGSRVELSMLPRRAVMVQKSSEGIVDVCEEESMSNGVRASSRSLQWTTTDHSLSHSRLGTNADRA